MLSCERPLAGVVWASLACALVGMFGSLDILLVGSSIALKKMYIYIYIYIYIFIFF